MDGFKTARVLILDDEPEQAMPVIHALGLLGIGAIYNNGAADAVYPEKLTGVRVMFVDMVLAAHGADANDPKACAGMVAEALNRLIEDSCDPVVVICWTGHKEMTTDFEAALRKTFTKAKIDSVLLAEKSNLSKPEDLDNLKKLISDALAAQNPVNVLFRWEQMVHDAATRTTGAITRLVQQFAGADASAWNQCGYRICAALALAERGSRLTEESESHAVKALFDALNPLLNDRLDHATGPGDATVASVGAALLQTVKDESEQWDKGRKCEDAKRRDAEGRHFVQQNFAAEIPPEKLNSLPAVPAEALSLLSAELRAALNTMLHLSRNVTPPEVCPGNVFFVERDSPNRKKLKDKLTDNFLRWPEAVSDTFFLPDNKLPANHFPVLIEFSAACDFAQDKNRLPKFVLGFFVPDSGMPNVRRTGYTRALGPLLLANSDTPKLDGVYHLVLNAHYVFGIEHQVASELKPLLRLRTAILAELSLWIANHLSRLGALHVGP